MLKSGHTAKIIGVDPITKTYKIMGSDNKVQSVKSDEIEKAEPSRYDNYQTAGPNPENPDELLIKQKDVNVDQSL